MFSVTGSNSLKVVILVASSAVSVVAPELLPNTYLLGLEIYETTFTVTTHQCIIILCTVNVKFHVIIITNNI